MKTTKPWPYTLPHSTRADQVVEALIENGWVLLQGVINDEALAQLNGCFEQGVTKIEADNTLRISDTRFSEFIISDAQTTTMSGTQSLSGNHSKFIQFSSAALLNNELFQQVSSLYLGSESVFASRIQFIRTYAMPDNRNTIPFAAHFDRVRFLKFYVYLNDITEEQGAIKIGDREWVTEAQRLRDKFKASGKKWSECDGIPLAYEGCLRSVSAKKGSVLIFDSNQPHCHGLFNAEVQRKVCILESQLIEELEFGYMGSLALSAREELSFLQ